MKDNKMTLQFFHCEFEVELLSNFRVMEKLPKTYKEVALVSRKNHSNYESGLCHLYIDSKKQYYLTTYFDGCFKPMKAKIHLLDDTLQRICKLKMEIEMNKKEKNLFDSIDYWTVWNNAAKKYNLERSY